MVLVLFQPIKNLMSCLCQAPYLMEINDLVTSLDQNAGDHGVSSLLVSYDKFKFDNESKLEEWLREEP